MKEKKTTIRSITIKNNKLSKINYFVNPKKDLDCERYERIEEDRKYLFGCFAVGWLNDERLGDVVVFFQLFLRHLFNFYFFK